MKIIFMGSPEFAMPALKSLLNSSHQVVCVYTQPPRKKDRGHQVQLTPVHQLAAEHNIEVRTPTKLRSEEVIKRFQHTEADVVVVVAYGLLLPKEFLYDKKFGSINIHPSFLPKFRGAAPLQWTILSGDTESAVCVMKLDEGMDTGDVLLQQNFHLDPRVTFAELHNYTAELGANLLLKTLHDIESICPKKQNNDQATHAPKLDKLSGMLDFDESVLVLDRKIRALNPWPGTFFNDGKENIKILASSYIICDHCDEIGYFNKAKKAIACKDGFLFPEILQRAGKKQIDIDDFLRGY